MSFLTWVVAVAAMRRKLMQVVSVRRGHVEVVGVVAGGPARRVDAEILADDLLDPRRRTGIVAVVFAQVLRRGDHRGVDGVLGAGKLLVPLADVDRERGERHEDDHHDAGEHEDGPSIATLAAPRSAACGTEECRTHPVSIGRRAACCDRLISRSRAWSAHPPRVGSPRVR
jgi:hypothetical protein